MKNDINIKITKEMTDFISGNPTAFHTVDSICSVLKDKGYKKLKENSEWKIEKGCGYYVCRGGSSVVAFFVGKDIKEYSFNIVSTHSDSPSFKIKEKSQMNGKKYLRLNVEGYGGMICYSWLDRPLSVAGRVLVKTKNGVDARLINIDRDLFLIPSVAIHMDRNVNDGYKFNKQIDMLPLFGQGEREDALLELVAKECKAKKNDILGSDLYLYVRDDASIWGCDNEFVSSPRLDDQQCAFASLKALTDSENSKGINVLACFDNEEVGSLTKQGADSTFLFDVLRRINHSLENDEETYLRAVAGSFMLSADNAHAVHPNHPEHTDDTNCAYINEGVVVKEHAGQKYTSDGMSKAIVRYLASRANVPLQFFANRSDKAGGSTLGNIAMSHVSICSADVGLAQLAMHSSYETAGTKDTLYMINLMKELYSTNIFLTETGFAKE